MNGMIDWLEKKLQWMWTGNWEMNEKMHVSKDMMTNDMWTDTIKKK